MLYLWMVPVHKVMDKAREALLGDGTPDVTPQALHVRNVVVCDKMGCKGKVPGH